MATSRISVRCAMLQTDGPPVVKHKEFPVCPEAGDIVIVLDNEEERNYAVIQRHIARDGVTLLLAQATNEPPKQKPRIAIPGNPIPEEVLRGTPPRARL